MSDRSPLEVVIAGGGVAAVELVLALDALAGRRVHVTLVAPGDELDIRALRTITSLTGEPPARVPLATIARRTHTQLVRGTLEQVVTGERTAILGDGTRLRYDALVVAVGATPVAPYGHGVATAGSASEGPAVAAAIDALAAGRAQSLAFVVPPGVVWTLPLYELALLGAQRLADRDVSLHLVTPEPAPLAIFGPEPVGAATALLSDAGIALHLGAYADIDAPGQITLRPHGHELAADRIIALARPAGRAPAGVPADADGFISVDDSGRVRAADDVFAVGDATDFPVKQGGLACQLADVVAQHLAARAGADVVPSPFRPVLRGQLLGGARTLHMRSSIAGGGGPGAATSRAIWRPSHKVDGLYLSRMLEDDPAFAIPPIGADIAVRLPSPSELERNPLALDPYSPSPLGRTR